MSRFIITEDEKKRIRKLYKGILSEVMVNTEYPESSKVFGCVNLETDKGDNWGVGNKKDKREYVELYWPNSLQILYVDGKVEQWTKNAKTKTKDGTWKCENDKITYNWISSNQGTNDEIYKYNYPGDTEYVYGVKDGHWWAKYIPTGKEADLSADPRWTKSVENLNIQFPNAIQGVSSKTTKSTNLDCIKIDTSKGDVKDYYQGAKMWFVRKWYVDTYDVYWENNTYQTFNKTTKAVTNTGTWRCNPSEENGFSIESTNYKV